MNEARKKMLERVKAILAKTMENGCSEAEAMTALAKARELMATYEIDETEFNQFDQEQAQIHRTSESDPYEIKYWLGKFVGKFTRCRAWAGKDKIVLFAGLESDVIFATWLLDTLQRFVMRALRDYQKKLIVEKGGMHSNRLTSASFVSGCTTRICEKLKELSLVEETKNALVEAELAKNGIVLHKRKASEQNIHEASARAGYEKGDNARFDRPVSSGGRIMLK